MANDNITPLRHSDAASAASEAAGDDLGIGPEIQMYLGQAAAAVRKAVAATERACASTGEGSDAEMRCAEVLEQLAEVLRRLE